MFPTSAHSLPAGDQALPRQNERAPGWNSRAGPRAWCAF